MKEKYQENTKISNTLIFIAIVMMAISFFAVYFNRTLPNIDKVDTVIQRDTIRHVDTLTIFKEKLVPKYKYLTKIDTFYTKDGKDTVLKTENKVYQDTLCNKKDSIILQSYISGQNAQLDSIKADWRKSETIITNTVEITKYINKKRNFWDRLSIGPAVTAGYDPINKQFGMTIGVGAFFDIK